MDEPRAATAEATPRRSRHRGGCADRADEGTDTAPRVGAATTEAPEVDHTVVVQDLSEIQREVDVLRRRVAALERRSRNLDSRHPATLAAIHRYVHAAVWTASELIEDARRGDDALWFALDELVVCDRKGAAIRLGLWLKKHLDRDADGFRLESPSAQDEVRIYRVVKIR